MKLKRRTMKRGRIEMIPLIDTVFLLLVFFIYAMLSMVVHRGIRLDLPQASTAALDRTDYISISVDASGVIYMDKIPLGLAELKEKLTQKKQLQPQLKVFIAGQRTVDYQNIIEVLDTVRQAGITQVALETKWNETPEGI
ncbi:MAG: biopolymer transporter ExbD [Deltaproteobacteria bacterium]|nr:biopolymer transporter ExbD [Deltaproteobacteria bacterium]MBW2071510.1 biopolymer transporter ExbD [Deltaproteobacteria bacterium]